MNRRHASSNSARLIAPLLKMCSLGALCLVLSSFTNIAPRLDCILTGGNGGLCPGKWHAQRHRRRGLRPASSTL